MFPILFSFHFYIKVTYDQGILWQALWDFPKQPVNFWKISKCQKSYFIQLLGFLQNGKPHIFLHSSYAAEISLHFLIRTRPSDRLLDVIDLLKTAGTKKLQTHLRCISLNFSYKTHRQMIQWKLRQEDHPYALAHYILYARIQPSKDVYRGVCLCIIVS